MRQDSFIIIPKRENITKSDDTLWDIAKRYGTTVNKIMETNNLASEDIKTGMKLLVVKSC